jgi:hypothetical protein
VTNALDDILQSAVGAYYHNDKGHVATVNVFVQELIQTCCSCLREDMINAMIDMKNTTAYELTDPRWPALSDCITKAVSTSLCNMAEKLRTEDSDSDEEGFVSSEEFSESGSTGDDETGDEEGEEEEEGDEEEEDDEEEDDEGDEEEGDEVGGGIPARATAASSSFVHPQRDILPPNAPAEQGGGD